MIELHPRALGLGVLLTLFATLSAPTLGQAGALVFHDVTVIPMGDETVIDDGVVVIRDGRIAAVGPRAEVDVPGEARRIDGRGGYLVPGLIDAHVHIRKASVLRLYLAFGFTTVRDMNGNLSATRAARDLVAGGEILGARLRAASPTMLAEPFRDYPAPSTAEQGRALAARLRAEGYDLIKVFRVQRQAFFGLMEGAAEQGIPVSGHVPDVGLDAEDGELHLRFEEVLGSGMASLEHILEVVTHGSGDDDTAGRLTSVARQVAESGMPVVTLADAALMNNAMKLERESLVQERRPLIERYFGATGIDQLRAIDTDPWTVVPEERVLEIVRAFHEAGVQLVVGTDSHFVSSIAGDAGLRELALLQRAGLSPRAALRAATVHAADLLGLGEETGRIAPGLAADLILLERDPLTDVAALRELVGVMRAGRWLDAPALERLREGAIVEGL